MQSKDTFVYNVHCLLSSALAYLILVLKNLSLQKNLENTVTTLQDLQENHRRLNSKMKEKEFIISNLLHSGKYNVPYLSVS